MQKKPDQILIGLTGNIATGKSIVRKMLEHLDAAGIDADALAHRSIAQGSPGYEPVLEEFGRDVIDPSGEINRSRLARIVFSNPDQLSRLENIIHPLVRKSINNLLFQSKAGVVVVEAIKLIESGLANICDSVWVTCSNHDLQIERLMDMRGLSENEARRRVDAQPLPEGNISAADVMIENLGSLEVLWNRVRQEHSKIILNYKYMEFDPNALTSGALRVVKCLPEQAGEIAGIITSLSGGRLKPSSTEIITKFAQKTFLCIYLNEQPVSIAGWTVENFAAITDEIYIDKTFPASSVIRELISAGEIISKHNFNEILLFFLPNEFSQFINILINSGYQSRYIHNLASSIWKETATKSIQSNSFMFIKELKPKIFFI